MQRELSEDGRGGYFEDKISSENVCPCLNMGARKAQP